MHIRSVGVATLCWLLAGSAGASAAASVAAPAPAAVDKGSTAPVAPSAPAAADKASTAPVETPDPAAERARIAARPAHVLTVSGGISLGSYEAGLNWAMVRYLKLRPGAPLDGSLVAATGASAGNVNAFLSAATWCQDASLDAEESPRSNLFWKAWIPVGWSRLFPEDSSCSAYKRRFPSSGLECDHEDAVYQSDDGVFTRRAFKDMEGALERHLGKSGRFVPGCALDVGVTLTKVQPARVKDPTLELEFDTQRYAVVLHGATTPDGAFGFQDPGELLAFPEQPGRSQLIHLPRDAAAQVRVADVLSVIEASSAFPVAFGPKLLGFCPEDRGGAVSTAGFACSGRSETARFVDGGVFDNLPLGLALTLRSTRTPPAAGLRFLSIDPTSRRPRADRGSIAPEAKGRGLTFLFDLLGSLVGVARQYELQIVARLLEENPKLKEGRSFVLSSRFFPIFGEHLGAFAGFLAQPFREYDFHVGVYDGLYELSRRDCEAGIPREEKVALARCTADRLRAAHDVIVGTGASGADTSFMVRRIFALELSASLERGELAAVRAHAFPDGETVDHWLGALDRRRDLLAQLVKVNAGLDRRLRPELHRSSDAPWVAGADEQFAWLLAELRASGAAPWFGEERGIIEDPAAWQRGTFVRVAARLLEIEKLDADATLEPVREVWEFALRSDLVLRSVGPDFDPSTIPDEETGALEFLFHFAPHHLARDPIREGWELGWDPTFGLSSHLALSLPVALRSQWGPGRHFASGGPGVALRPGGGWGLVFSSIELSPRLTVEFPGELGGFEASRHLAPGVEAAAFLVGGKLRLAFGAERRDEQLQGTFTFGLADLNGLLYWIVRWSN